jgi:hypothetical protein
MYLYVSEIFLTEIQPIGIGGSSLIKSKFTKFYSSPAAQNLSQTIF